MVSRHDAILQSTSKQKKKINWLSKLKGRDSMNTINKVKRQYLQNISDEDPVSRIRN